MPTHPFVPILAALLVTVACQVDPKSTTDSDPTSDPTAGTETSGSSTETSAVTETSGSSTETSADTDTGEAVTETSADTDTGEAATETSPGTDSGATETGETGDPASCPGEGPGASTSYEVKLDGWPGQSEEDHDVERECTVDAVTVEGDQVITALTCDVDGVPLGASFMIAAAPEGEVDWAVGEAVTLDSRFYKDEFGLDAFLRVTRAGDPDALLVDVQNWWGDSVAGKKLIGPIVRESTNSCEVSEDTYYELKYSLETGASLSLWSGTRGALPIDMTHVYAIDLKLSRNDCCHGSERSLIRRVKSG